MVRIVCSLFYKFCLFAKNAYRPENCSSKQSHILSVPPFCSPDIEIIDELMLPGDALPPSIERKSGGGGGTRPPPAISGGGGGAPPRPPNRGDAAPDELPSRAFAAAACAALTRTSGSCSNSASDEKSMSLKTSGRPFELSAASRHRCSLSDGFVSTRPRRNADEPSIFLARCARSAAKPPPAIAASSSAASTFVDADFSLFASSTGAATATGAATSGNSCVLCSVGEKMFDGMSGGGAFGCGRSLSSD